MAQSLDPILSALQTTFQNALSSGGTVPFDSTTLGSAGSGIITLFSDNLGVSSVVAGNTPTIEPDTAKDTLTVAGTSTGPLLDVTNPAISAVFTVSGQTLEIVLTIGTGSGWTIASSFPLLGKTIFNNLTFDSKSPLQFILCSQDGPSDAYGPVLQTGLNLSFNLVLNKTSPASQLQTLLPSIATSLPLAGPVSIATGAESLSMRGSGPDFSMKLPYFIPLPFGSAAPVLSGSSVINELHDQVDTLALQVWGSVGAGGVDLPLMVSVPLGLNAWGIGLIPGASVSFGQLTGIFSALPILDVVPDATKNLSALLLDEFALVLTPDRSSFAYLSVTVESSPTAELSWTIVPGVLVLTSVGVGLMVDSDSKGNLTTTGWISGTMALGSSLSIGIQVQLPIGTGPWTLTAYPSVGLPDLGTLAGLMGGASLANMLPSGLGSIGAFNLDFIQVVMDPATLTFSSLSFSITSTQPWLIIPNQLVIKEIDIQVEIDTPLSNPQLSGEIDGIIVIGEVDVEVSVARPSPTDDWYLSVQAQDVDLPSLSDIAQLAGTDISAFIPSSLANYHFTIYRISLLVDLSTRQMQVFSVSIGSNDHWTIVDPYVVLQEVDFGLILDWRSGSLFTSGFINGQIEIGTPPSTLTLALGAEYPGTGGWIFTGGMLPGDILNLTAAVKQFLPSLPPQVPDITLANVGFTFNTADDSFTFQAETGQPWKLDITGDLSFSLSASVQIERTISKTTKLAEYSGYIEGDLSSHFGTNNLGLGVRYAFQPNSNTYTFKLSFNKLSLTANLITGKDTVLTVQLGDLTFGEIVTYLVNLADPSLHFELTSPWDILNKINFKNLTLVINFTKKSVGISYALGQNLGLVNIKTIGLNYLQRNGKGTVDIFFTGSFFGQEYSDANPLTWDMLNDPPPTPPGQGSQLFDLQYLGLGQHLALVDPKADTMALVLQDLAQTVLNASGGKAPWTLLQFDRSSNWLIGAQFTVMGFLSLGGVFNDPNLYGLRITLSGAKAGSFGGLDFEILYRKISDTIGVYHISLKLPDAMRHLEFGEVSVTLPVIVIDIYTNGNFRIDFGFPVNGDFSNSFALEVFPFLGYGGFYFALLSGETSTRVPKISNGNFNPVIEFGLALAIGVGKDFQAGPLKAGVSVAVQGILQGVIGWFNPSDSSAPSDHYYWVQGTIAIVGKLYGEVDFVIIKASISVVAYASATLTVEAYQPILIALSVGVTVTASVKIVFFTIHFSFSMHLDVSFVIGSASTPPWNVIAPPSGSTVSAARVSLLARQRRAHAYRSSLSQARLLNAAAAGLTWQPVAVMPGAPVVTGVNILPAFTVAGTQNPQTQAVMALFAPNSIAPTALTANEVRLVAGANPGASTFDLIVQALLLWSIQTQLGRLTGSIAETDLADLYNDLNGPARDAGFTYTNLSTFLGLNFRFLVGQFDAGSPPSGATIVPMPPAFTMTPQGITPVDFAAHPVDSTYEQQIANYFNQLGVNYNYYQAQDPLQAPVPPPPPPEDNESLASLIFRDYFLMLAKSAVQSCLDLLKNYPYTVVANGADSLAGITAEFSGNTAYVVQPDDTLYLISAAFDVAPAVIMAANTSVNFSNPLEPGTTLQIPPRIADAIYYSVQGDTLANLASSWGVSQEAIQSANSGVDFSNLQAGTELTVPISALLFALAEANMDAQVLNSAVTLALQAVPYQVRNGDSLAGIGQKLGVSAADIATLNAAATGIFAPGSTMQVALAGQNYFTYVPQTEDTLAMIAAYILVRGNATQGDPNVAWFSATITNMNPSVDFGQALPTGTVLAIPNAILSPQGQGISQQQPDLQYMTKAGDTLDLIAGYFLLTEIEPDDLADLMAQIQSLNPTIKPGTPIKIPAQTYALSGSSTFAGVSALFGVAVADLATTNSAITTLLAPQASLVMPTLNYTIKGTDTLAIIAAASNLSLEGLIGRIGNVAHLFALTSSGKTVTVPQALQVPIADLLNTFTGQGEANNLAGVVSRFLLHGLQLPDPTDQVFRAFELEEIAAGLANGTTGFSALYELTGQQFPAPSSAGYTITFSNSGAANWLVFTSVYNSISGDTLSIIATKFNVGAPQLQQINPDVDWDNLPVGTAINIPQPQLQIVITQTVIDNYYPSTQFAPNITSGPQRLPLAQQTPVRFTLSQLATWQSAVPVPFAATPPSSQPVGMPTLLFFPSTLISQVQSAAGHPYDLVAGRLGDLSLKVTPINAYDWATCVPITVRQLPDAAGSQMPNSYLMLGADQNGRDVLVDLLDYLQGQGKGDTAQLYLLYAADPTDQNPSGYISDAVDPGNTLLLKTNLSTLTHSGPQAMEAVEMAIPPSGDYYATLIAGQAFIQLLWECSITGSGGFYLNYAIAGQPGQGLPANLFANGNEATLWLVVILGSQSAQQTPNRTLYSFSNCTIVQDKVDPQLTNIFAEVSDGSNPTVVATVPPGNVGIELSRTNPSTLPQSASQLTASLFSLMEYALPAGSNTFFASNMVVLPAGPVQDDPNTMGGLPMPLAANAEDNTWYFKQVIPIYQLAVDKPALISPMLPSPAQDPYAGIAAGSQVTIALGFRDVFGNEITASPAIPDVEIPVGYYDPLLGLSSWPSATGTYAFDSDGGAPELCVFVNLDLSKYIPGSANPFAAAVRSAAAHLLKYQQAYYQVQQSDVQFYIQTSMDQPSAGPTPDPAAHLALANFITAATIYLNVAQGLQPVLYQVASGNENLSSVATAYDVSLSPLVQANASADASLLFGAPLVIPRYHVAAAGDTWGSIAASGGLSVTQLLQQNNTVPLSPGVTLTTAASTYTTAPGDSLSSISELLPTDVANIANANAATPNILNKAAAVTVGGVTIQIKETDTFASLVTAFAGQGVTTTPAGIAASNLKVQDIFLPDVKIAIAQTQTTPGNTSGSRSYSTVKGDTIASIAAQQFCTVAGIAIANSQTPNILNPANSVSVQGVTAAIAAGDTFVSLVAKFAAQNVSTSAAGIAIANQGLPDLLLPQITLLITDYVTQPKDTLSALTTRYSQFTIELLAGYNGSSPQNIFPTGSPLYLSQFTYTAQPGQSLAAIAQANSLTLDELATWNGTTKLTVGAEIAIPGAVLISKTKTPQYAAYQATGSDTLATIAGNLGVELGDLGNLNALMPNLFNVGVKIAYPGHELTTKSGDTFTSLAAQADVPVATFVADPSVSGLAGLVAGGALFVLDLPVVGNNTLNQLADNYDVNLDDLAWANSALIGFVSDGAPFSYGGKTLNAKANDTLQSLVYRFANEQGVTASVPALAEANKDQSGLLVATSQFVVPPQRVTLSVPFTKPFVPAPIFPLTVAIGVDRSTTLVDPEFAGVEDVLEDWTPLAPLATANSDGSLSLQNFAASFEQTFASLRLKVGTGTPADNSDTTNQPVWVANFGNGGFSQVAVEGGTPFFYALAPLNTELESRSQVSIQPYDPKTGTLGTAQLQNFQSVDLDVWLSQLLQAIDLFLTPQYAVPAFLISSTSVEQVVAAKGAIAGYLKERVLPILEAPAPQPDSEQLAAAQEALYQSMLVNLSSALETDALVQFQVDVQAPYSQPYTTGTADGVSQVAAAYQVSIDYAAQVLATVAGILNSGVTVTYNSQNYTVTVADTLLTVAQHFGVSVQQLAGGAQTPAGQGLLAPGVTLPVSMLQKAPAATDTFVTMADYFGASIGTVAIANEARPDTLTPQQTIKIGTTTYQVQKGDTLLKVAAAFQMTPDVFASNPAVADVVGLLNTATTFYCSTDSGQSAPRLSGKPVVRLYVTGPADAFAALLAYYQVSQDALLPAIQTMTRILNTGATVTYSSQPYQLTAADTLQTVAAHFNVSAADFVNGVQLPAGTGLFSPNTSINVSRVSTKPTAQDSFQTLAAFFGATPDEVATANQNLQDIFVAQEQITIGTTKYTVQPGDTLIKISAAFGLTPATFAANPAIAPLKGLFNPQATLFGLQALPDNTFSTAKVALTNGGSLVTFLFNTPQDADYRNLFFNLNYVVNEMEYNIGNVPGVENYQSSNWLTFVIPIASTADVSGVSGNIGQVDIPIPLRTYPTPPSLLTQGATASHPTDNTFPGIKEWDFAFSYQHQDAAQDTPYIQATFNEVKTEAFFAEDDAFAPLAQFVQVYPALKETLSQLLYLAGGEPSQALQGAVATFATLVQGVANVWGGATPHLTTALHAGATTGTSYLFMATYTYTPTQPPNLDSLTLTVLLPADPSQALWPKVEVYNAATGNWEQLSPEPPAGNERVYNFTGITIQAFTPLSWRFTFPDNDVVVLQNAWGGVYLTRNEGLVSTAPTNSAFVYQTPLVRFNDDVVPLLTYDGVYNMGQGSGLANAVQAFLGNMLNATAPNYSLDASYTLRMTLLYGHTLLPAAQGGIPLTSYVPVVFLPQVTLDQNNTIPNFASELNDQVTAWENVNHPIKVPGDTYVLQVVLYSNLPGQTTRPVLQLGLPTYTIGGTSQ